MVEILTDVINKYRKKDGPLPSYPPGNIIGSKFWAFYQNPNLPKNLLGVKTSVAWKAGLAGITRSKSEPGIDPMTDERVKCDV